METKTVIESMQWVETPLRVVEDVTELAMIETGRVCQDSLCHFQLIEQVGRVVLVSFCPKGATDPVMPLVLKSSPAIRSAARGLFSVMLKSYAEITQAGARYVEAAANYLSEDELRFLRHQVKICAVDPMRQFAKVNK